MANYAGTQTLGGKNITLGGLLTNGAIGAVCGYFGGPGWMRGQTTSAFVAFAGKNVFKHLVGMVGVVSLLNMFVPAFVMGGIGGGVYGRFSEMLNPDGKFIGF